MYNRIVVQQVILVTCFYIEIASCLLQNIEYFYTQLDITNFDRTTIVCGHILNVVDLEKIKSIYIDY